MFLLLMFIMIVMSFLIFMPKSRLSLFKVVYSINYVELLRAIICSKDWTKIGNAINLQTC